MSELSNIPPTRELFAPHKITHVSINYWPNRAYTSKKCDGRISFTHNDFESDKNFKGNDFDDVIGQMRTFLETLKTETGLINDRR